MAFFLIGVRRVLQGREFNRRPYEAVKTCVCESAEGLLQ